MNSLSRARVVARLVLEEGMGSHLVPRADVRRGLGPGQLRRTGGRQINTAGLTLRRGLSSLEQAGLIERLGDNIRVVDVAALAALAYDTDQTPEGPK